MSIIIYHKDQGGYRPKCTIGRFILIISALLVIGETNSQIMWQIKKDTVLKWYYYDGDEFDGPTIDSLKWMPAYAYTRTNYRFDYLMSSKRLEFDSGVCKFTCYRDSGLVSVPAWHMDSAFKKEYGASLVEGNKFRYLYSCGNIWSKQKYSKGYFEIRFKATASYGMWPAFWMYGTNRKDEIDFFELKGEKKRQIHVDVHCPSGCDHGYKGGSIFPKSFGGWIKTDRDLNENYNVLAGEWQDGYIKWHLNGEGIAVFKGDLISQKMDLILGTGPAKDGYAFDPGPNETSFFPNSIDVDYIRIWYKENTTKDSVLGKKSTTFSFYKSGKNEKAFLKKKIRYMYSGKEFKKDLLTISILPGINKKIILCSLGREINYEVAFNDTSGKQILSKDVKEDFNEFDLSTLTSQLSVKVKFQVSDKVFEESVNLH